MTKEREELIETWLGHHALIVEGKTNVSTNEGFWAWEQLKTLVLDSPEEAWPIILELIRRAPSDRILAGIAAGPLEDIIRKHTDAFIDRVELEARRDPRFRLCLTGVWYGNDLAERVRRRIEKYTSSSKHLDEA